jgi:hypothetical protein
VIVSYELSLIIYTPSGTATFLYGLKNKLSIKDLQIPYTSLGALVSRVVAHTTLSLTNFPYAVYRILTPQVKALIIT